MASELATDLVPLRASGSIDGDAAPLGSRVADAVAVARRSSWNGILRSPLRSRQPTPTGSPLLRRVQLTRLRHMVAPPTRVFPLQMSDNAESASSSAATSTAATSSATVSTATSALTSNSNGVTVPGAHFDTLEFITTRSPRINSADLEERSLSAPCSPAIAHKFSSSPGALSRGSSMSGDHAIVPPPPYPGAVELLSTSAPSPGCSKPPLSPGAASNGNFFVATPSSPGVSGSYPFQEIREIMVTRFEDEPFGMKVGRIGDGYYITHVVKESAACCAGLKVGDEIVRVNDKSVDRLITDEVLQMIRDCDASVKLAYKPRAVISRVREICLQKEGGVLGLRLQRRADGLYIDFVKSGTPASASGLKDGDQVLRMNSQPVSEWTQEQAMHFLKNLSPQEMLVLCIRETLPLAHVTGSQPVLAQLATAASYSEPASPLISSRNAC